MTPPVQLLLSGLMALSLVAGAAASRAQEPGGDDELGRHLADARERLDDPSIEPAVREEMALETAATLDRAARSALDLDTRLARWDAAVALLDEFDRKNMDHRRRREFGLQAAVYRWAQARALHDRRAMQPAQAGPPERESAALDDAISRLRMIVGGEAGSLSDNVRFRLAWALADRAALEASGSPTAAMRREEALDLLKDPPAEPSLSGFQSLLKARLLRESGKLDLAYFQVDEATRSASPPPEAEVLDVLVPILIDLGRFEDAAGKVESSGLSSPAKALHKLRIDLAARRAAPAGDEGRERRRTLEADLLKQIGTLREARPRRSASHSRSWPRRSPISTRMAHPASLGPCPKGLSSVATPPPPPRQPYGPRPEPMRKAIVRPPRRFASARGGCCSKKAGTTRLTRLWAL